MPRNWREMVKCGVGGGGAHIVRRIPISGAAAAARADGRARTLRLGNSASATSLLEGGVPGNLASVPGILARVPGILAGVLGNLSLS